MSYYRRSRTSPEHDINILLLGETGVGKTTFINTFINCLFYDTLDDALNGDLKVLIPSSFTFTDSESFNSTKIMVRTPNTNENFQEDGASSTQSCRSYIFPIGDRLLRLINGPGISDTRSADHQPRNFENILRYINQYEHLNSICIFFEADMTRVNAYFRYCVKELLRHLHINAKDNIMFVLTHSRATFYRSGSTCVLVRNLLTEFQKETGVEVPFCSDNTFMFDNESFRYLAICQQGLTFLKKKQDDYCRSWNKSVQEFTRLITRILQCDLHAVPDKQSLNGRAQAATTDEHHVDLPTGLNSSQIMLQLKEVINKKKR